MKQMGFQANAGETNPDGKGATWVNQECKAQFYIEDVTDFTATPEPYYEVKGRVISTDTPEMLEREHKERFYVKSAGGQGRFIELACATGIYDKNTWRKAKEAGASIEFDEKEMVARCFCGKISIKPNKDNPEKHYANLDFNIWGCGDEDAFDIPLDEEYVNSNPNGLVRKDGTLFKRTAAPVPKAKDGNGGTPPAGNGAKPKQPAPTNSPAKTAQRQTAAASAATTGDLW